MGTTKRNGLIATFINVIHKWINACSYLTWQHLQHSTAANQTESKEDGANPCNKDISGRQALVHTAFMPELQMYIHKILQLALNSSKLTEIYSNNYMN